MEAVNECINVSDNEAVLDVEVDDQLIQKDSKSLKTYMLSWDDTIHIDEKLSDTFLESKLLVKMLMDGNVNGFRLLLYVLCEIRGLTINPLLLGVCFAFASKLGDIALMKELHKLGAWIDAFFVRNMFKDDPSPYEHLLLDFYRHPYAFYQHHYVYGNALYFACCNGDMSIVEYLVEELEMKDNFSAMGKAIACGHSTIVEWLLDHPQCLTEFSVEHAMCAAVFKGDKALLIRLIAIRRSMSKNDLSSSMKGLEYALRMAAFVGHADILSYLLELPGLLDKLEERYEYEYFDGICRTILEKNNTDLLRILLDSSELCPSMCIDEAVKHENWSMVEYVLSIIDEYTDTSYCETDTDTYYRDALILAAKNKNVKIFSALLQKHPPQSNELIIELISHIDGYVPILEELIKSLRQQPVDESTRPLKKSRTD